MNRYVPALHYIVGAALLIAVLPMPYGYYQLLRIGTFITFAALAYDAHTSCRGPYYWLWLLGLALLYNPVVPIHFERELWAVLNVLAAVALGGDLLYRRRDPDRGPDES
tara:strand:- start:1206 stop:1532 length:327 start_codon:yes stop_codon:yes gene_type:complete